MSQNNTISQEKEKLRKELSPLGLVSGRIGSFVFRIYKTKKNGKIIVQQRIATLPKHYNTNKRKDLQDNRYSFKTTALFAKEVISHPQLKKLWTIAAKGKLSAYNYINKINYHLTSPSAPSEKNLIAPVKTPLQVENLNITPYAITGEIPYKKNSTLIAFLSFSEPSSDNTNHFQIISISLPVTTNSFTIPVTKQIKELSLLYNKFTLFITSISESGKKITTSGTFTTTGISHLFISLPFIIKPQSTHKETIIRPIIAICTNSSFIRSYYANGFIIPHCRAR